MRMWPRPQHRFGDAGAQHAQHEVGDSRTMATSLCIMTHANGNAWFVNEVKFVPNADAEIQALGKLDLKHQAVADAQFESLLKGATDGQGHIELKHYAPNELRYTSGQQQRRRGGVLRNLLSGLDGHYRRQTGGSGSRELCVARPPRSRRTP